ncbi:ABC transporter substrate-binding protein [Cohnella lupini]|uniref:Iron complex transport system substrate-binding protein n=1 Tax=Cohnella lupini TaxID=1294267 RepID=A0A3D9IA87_9BACL|nr:ABC transporter substrate-binding protein [Cohnella lupini]RED58106.1 iron complex transport system substrate-binding protein [Cohnella lupini]
MFASNRVYRSLSVSIIAILLIAIFSACGNNNASENSASSPATETEQTSPSSEQASAYPKTIVHDKGETVLEAKPKTIAITYFPFAEHLFAIGEQAVVGGVVGLSSLKNFPVYDPFTKDGRIADLGDTPNLEKITALNPDVIIAWQDDEKIYDQLSKIAPTVLINQTENWQDTIAKVAALINEEDKAQQYMDDYNNKLVELASQMDQTGEKGKTAIFMMTWGKGFNYYGGERMAPYYEKLGFGKFKDMEDWGELSLESVSSVDPDYIFLGEDFTNTAEMKVEDLKTNPVWNNLKAVKNGKLFIVDTEIVGPLAMGQFKGLETIEGIIKDAK